MPEIKKLSFGMNLLRRADILCPYHKGFSCRKCTLTVHRKLSVTERCLYYRGIRIERFDCSDKKYIYRGGLKETGKWKSLDMLSGLVNSEADSLFK